VQVLASFLEGQAAVRERAHQGLESWVALEGDVRVGQVLISSADGVLELAELVVPVSARGRGVGSAMLVQVLARADAAGCTVRLHVEHGNPAVKLYRRHGFVDDGPAETLGQRMTRAAQVKTAS
jgi:ribosomal protein S18 acetylase RimI-like enzyme